MIDPALRARLRARLTAHRYASHSGQGMRGLMPHHVQALTEDLGRYVEAEVQAAVSLALNRVGADGPQRDAADKCYAAECEEIERTGTLRRLGA